MFQPGWEAKTRNQKKIKKMLKAKLLQLGARIAVSQIFLKVLPYKTIVHGYPCPHQRHLYNED